MTRPYHQVRVAEVIAEAAGACSLVLDIPPELASTFAYQPGQFLTVRVPSDWDGSVARCYSLCSSPHAGDQPAITVKRTDGGYASNWIADHLVAGSMLDTLPPAGTFTPRSLDRDFLLFAAGSGITPVMSILESALAAGHGQIVLSYANRDENSVIFGEALRDLSAKYPDRLTVVHWLETVQGLPTAAALAGLSAPYIGRDAYICGPGPFMAAAEEALKNSGAPADKIHIEVFKSLESDPFAAVVIEEDDSDEGPATAIVTLDGERHEVRWPRNAKLLDVLLDKGLDAPFSCREGHCGACAVLKKSGEVEMEVNDVLEQQDLDEGLILGCQAHPRSDSVEVTYDE
jgi:3-ketosteroid 9alpha-monooxygenase subunit B